VARPFQLTRVILTGVTLLAGHYLSAMESVPLKKGFLEASMDQARSENKHLYVAFLGEGWSLSSKRFKETNLNDPSFLELARQDLVYFPVEARRTPKLSPSETAVLQSWVIHFNIKSYPTLILLAPDGQELLRHGYREMSGPDYVQLLRSILPATTRN
jgi:hypothetical protein